LLRSGARSRRNQRHYSCNIPDQKGWYIKAELILPEDGRALLDLRRWRVLPKGRQEATLQGFVLDLNQASLLQDAMTLAIVLGDAINLDPEA
jgi:hypothetical protein